MCNAVLAFYLITDRRRPKNRERKDDQVVADNSERQSEMPVSKDESKTLVGASSFDIDGLEARMVKAVTDTVNETLPIVMKSMIGNVRMQDVEFGEDQSNTNESQTEEAAKFTPLSAKETDEAFDVDIRDVDDSEPSAPTATGVPLDELEERINSGIKSDATPEQQAAAGKLLADMKDTQLYERITSLNDDIDRRVNLCIRMNIQAEIKARNSESNSPKIVRKMAAVNIVPDNTDDFNPADMLP